MLHLSRQILPLGPGLPLRGALGSSRVPFHSTLRKAKGAILSFPVLFDGRLLRGVFLSTSWPQKYLGKTRSCFSVFCRWLRKDVMWAHFSFVREAFCKESFSCVCQGVAEFGFSENNNKKDKQESSVSNLPLLLARAGGSWSLLALCVSKGTEQNKDTQSWGLSTEKKKLS